MINTKAIVIFILFFSLLLAEVSRSKEISAETRVHNKKTRTIYFDVYNENDLVDGNKVIVCVLLNFAH